VVIIERIGGVTMQKLEFLKSTENRFDMLNNEVVCALDKINDSLMWGAMQYFKDTSYTWIEVPIMTKVTGACENVNTLYSVNHFGKEAYLAQTGQLYLEAKIPKHSKVWTTIISSRAEQKVDSRHLNQFSLVEFEQQGDFEKLLPTIEAIVQAMVANVLKENKKELEFLGRDINELEKYLKPFNRVTYTEAIKLLQANDFEIYWGDDLSHQAEMKILELHNNLPTFVTHFPAKIKFFNMRLNRDNKDIVNSADLLMPYSGESAGSAEREDDYEILVDRLKESNMYKILAERGVTLETFKDYLDLIKKNPILHAGAGIGFNRITQSILGLSDIRQTNNYPLNAETLY